MGDVIKLRAGMNLPVDGVVIHGSGLLVNESAMTGESDEMKKESPHHCAIRKIEKINEEKAANPGKVEF